MKPTNALAPRNRPTGVLAIRDGNRLMPLERPDEQTANGYLRLTAHILLKAQRQVFRSIGVISARDGEGKTTAAVNLAVCLGRTRGRTGRVLLIDGDARHRTLTKLVTSDMADIDQEEAAKHPMLVATGFEGVDLMTAPVTPDGLTLHDPAAWAQTIHDLSSRYTQIIIDCPSVLDNPEGLVLRECAEELVLVVKAGQTSRATIERALGNVNKRVLGVILNGGKARRRKVRNAS